MVLLSGRGDDKKQCSDEYCMCGCGSAVARVAWHAADVGSRPGGDIFSRGGAWCISDLRGTGNGSGDVREAENMCVYLTAGPGPRELDLRILRRWGRRGGYLLGVSSFLPDFCGFSQPFCERNTAVQFLWRSDGGKYAILTTMPAGVWEARSALIFFLGSCA